MEIIEENNLKPQILPAPALAHWVRAADHFNSGEYFEAHEEWEKSWPTLPQPDKDFVQGLIQICAVFIHIEKNNVGPAQNLCRLALDKMKNAKNLTLIHRIEIARAENVLQTILQKLETPSIDQRQKMMTLARSLKAVIVVIQ